MRSTRGILILTGKKNLYTYQIRAKDKLKINEVNREPDIPEEIPLRVLENFLKDPFKHYYNKVLEIYYEDPENLPEWELFGLDNLQEWSLKNSLLQKSLAGEELDLEEIRKEMILKGQLPLKSIGEQELEKVNTRIDALWKELEKQTNGRTLTMEEIDLKFTLKNNRSIKLNGHLSTLGEDAVYLFVSKAEKKKYELSAYLHYLVLKASGRTGALHYLCLDDNNEPFHHKIEVPKTIEKATKEIEEFLELYVENHERIIPFYPELNLKVEEVAACDDTAESDKIEKLRSLIDSKFEPFSNFYPSDYFLREYQQGFFLGDQGMASLLEFQDLYARIGGEIETAFNR